MSSNLFENWDTGLVMNCGQGPIGGVDKLTKAGQKGCLGKPYNGAALSKLKKTKLNERKKG